MNPYRARVLRRSRDAFAIAKPRYTFSTVRLRSPSPSLSSLLSVYSDRRYFRPDRVTAPAFSFVRSAARLIDRPSRSRVLAAPRARTVIGFANPSKVLVCVRRKARREVLMSKGVGGSRVRRPRRNLWSDVSC